MIFTHFNQNKNFSKAGFVYMAQEALPPDGWIDPDFAAAEKAEKAKTKPKAKPETIESTDLTQRFEKLKGKANTRADASIKKEQEGLNLAAINWDEKPIEPGNSVFNGLDQAEIGFIKLTATDDTEYAVFLRTITTGLSPSDRRLVVDEYEDQLAKAQDIEAKEKLLANAARYAKDLRESSASA